MDFEGKLSALVSKQLTGDADAIALTIERLANALGLAVAVSCRGNVALGSDMLTAVEGYVAEAVVNHAKLAAFMVECRQFRSENDGR